MGGFGRLIAAAVAAPLARNLYRHSRRHSAADSDDSDALYYRSMSSLNNLFDVRSELVKGIPLVDPEVEIAPEDAVGYRQVAASYAEFLDRCNRLRPREYSRRSRPSYLTDFVFASS